MVKDKEEIVEKFEEEITIMPVKKEPVFDKKRLVNLLMFLLCCTLLCFSFYNFLNWYVEQNPQIQEDTSIVEEPSTDDVEITEIVESTSAP